jgi:hypothetical protein
MGLISSYVRLGKLTNEMQKNQDVKSDMATMKSKMDAMKTSMAAANAAQAAALNPSAGVNRVQATATVVAARPANTWVQGSRLVDIDLTVSLPGGVLIPATQSSLVSPQNEFALRPGIQLAVTIDPRDPSSVAITW